MSRTKGFAVAFPDEKLTASNAVNRNYQITEADVAAWRDLSAEVRALATRILLGRAKQKYAPTWEIAEYPR